jgi:hypothetical protein
VFTAYRNPINMGNPFLPQLTDISVDWIEPQLRTEIQSHAGLADVS